MSRSGRVIKSLHASDPVYGNRLLGRFINRVMHSGKKRTAERQVYGALDVIKEKGEDPIKVFETAIANAGPKMEVKARRVGGASYQVPTEVRGDRRVALAMRWIVGFANKRSNKEYKSFAEKLAVELMEAAKGQGDAIKKRDTVHRMAEANRAFAHFKW
ncbi:30S ribosomal protein S7 [Candidatus Gottesmanbacteria bacterium RBG_13_45_10]|uniref:Small ribosomal subunit protein uS7 n=1 Tax=Candidatus Gottesmanbacteria bacterium RBG_13_45_10 TaxID=1798370 RepID=A0A1F5ZHS3_9BACT|nr:MAG: 30S ribosomal protein S7 [Candidatus Gottesmanbacteria bacterium RBG_13_45_10]